MRNLKEKVAYLQGLRKGLDVKDHSAEGKLLLSIIDVLDDVADEVNSMHSVQEDLENYVETIDEDLTDLEEQVYESDYDDDYIEVKCPYCQELVAFESDMLQGNEAVEVTCPYCGKVVYDSSYEITDVVAETSSEASLRHGLNPGI